MVHWYWLIVAYLAGFIIGKIVTLVKVKLNPRAYLSNQDKVDLKMSKINTDIC